MVSTLVYIGLILAIAGGLAFTRQGWKVRMRSEYTALLFIFVMLLAFFNFQNNRKLHKVCDAWPEHELSRPSECPGEDSWEDQ